VKFPCYVICVGNATIGGTGKTQLVKWLVQKLQNEYKIVVITKAYGVNLQESVWVGNKSAQAVGDESKLLSAYAPVIAAPNPASAIELVKEYQPEIIIFDDGMQNPSFHKDLIILTINATRGFGNGRIIPAGPLRQPIKSAISQADISIFIGHEASAEEQKLFEKKPFKALIEAKNIELVKEYFAFAGISNPESFFELLKQNGVVVKMSRSFPDHYNYREQDLQELLEAAKSQNLELITTEKDYVKIGDKIEKLNYLPVDLKFEPQEEEKFLDEIKSHLKHSLKLSQEQTKD
jgi:tetraacyldisaccharide 4'-kinase